MARTKARKPISATLTERGKVYGSFPEKARIIQGIKACMKDSPNWEELPDDMKESLEVIASKIGRILVGDASHADNWHDIAGYATLVEQELPA